MAGEALEQLSSEMAVGRLLIHRRMCTWLYKTSLHTILLFTTFLSLST